MIDIFINSGLDKGAIITLLLLPVVVTLIAFARHILGMRSLGIYLSFVITFIFFQLGVTSTEFPYYSDPLIGFKYGLPMILVVFSATLLCYLLIKKLGLHYYPKLAIVSTGVTVILIAVTMILGLLGFKNFLKIDIFTLVLIVAITEKYFSILARKNLKTTIFITLESIMLAGISYLIICIHPLIDLLLQYPYVILILFPVNYLIGRFTGLRLSEYLRFWDILTEKD